MIDLTKIPDDGLRLSSHRKFLSIKDGSVLRDISWQIFIMPSSFNFFIQVKSAATLVGICVRCLESITTTISADSKFFVSNDPALMVGGSYTLNKQDLDIVFFPGTILDEEDLIMEQFQLQVPTHILCRDTCKGLCCHCGNNYNKGHCCCSSEPHGSSNALVRALLALKLNLNDADVGDKNHF
jgi:uncharacterized metal-binding protein YceD (DUF177 family)